MTNEEREAYENLLKMRALFDEFVRNKPLKTVSDNGIVTWPVFKTQIRFDQNVRGAQGRAIVEYMNNRGIVGTYDDLMRVGQLGVDGYYPLYKQSS